MEGALPRSRLSILYSGGGSDIDSDAVYAKQAHNSLLKTSTTYTNVDGNVTSLGIGMLSPSLIMPSNPSTIGSRAEGGCFALSFLSRGLRPLKPQRAPSSVQPLRPVGGVPA